MKHKLMLIFLAMVLVVSLAGFVACKADEAPTDVGEIDESKAPTEVIEWRMPTFMPGSGDTWELYYLPFAERVKEASNGRLIITMYGAGEIIPVLEMWESVSKGVVDCCWAFGSYWTGKTSVASIEAGLPFTCGTIRDAFALKFYLGINDLVREEYAKHNIHLLWNLPTQETVLVTKFPVSSVDDLKGKKVRAGGLEAEVATELGMSATYFPVPEVYGALESGVVDAVIMGGLAASRMFSFYEVTEYVVYPPFNVGTGEGILINLDSWNALPDDLKQILISCAAQTNIDRLGYGKYTDTDDLNWMVENHGMKVQQLPPEEVAKMGAAAMRVYDRYAAESPIFAEALDIIKDYMRLRGLLD